jgi:hypothetical protein
MSIDARTAPVGGTVATVPRPLAPTGRWLDRIGSRGLGLIGALALVVLVALILGLVLAADQRASLLSPPSHAGFPGWMSGPLGHLWPSLTSDKESLKWAFSLTVGGMYLCYLLALLCAPLLSVRWLVGAVVALHVIFLLGPPLPLTDVFNYINYGRMGVVHHLNPYATMPALEPYTDPAFQFSNWHHLLSPYGPLFTLYTYALAPLGVPTGYWVLKLSLSLASLGSLALVWRCAQLLGRNPVMPFLFVGLNPLVLVWGLGGDHNDFFMMFFVLAGFYLLLRARAMPAGHAHPRSAKTPFLEGAVSPNGDTARGDAAGVARRELGAGAVLAGAIAIKASAGILLPVVLAGSRGRLRVLAGFLVGGLVLGTASLLAFGTHLPDLGEQSRLVTGVGLPNVLGYSLGLGGETVVLHRVLDVMLLVAVVGCSVWAWRREDWLPAAGVAMLALLVTLSWELPWYVYWLLPLAALGRSRALRRAALLLGAYLMLAWIPLVTDITRGLNFRPTATPLGEEHTHLTKRLLH